MNSLPFSSFSIRRLKASDLTPFRHAILLLKEVFEHDDLSLPTDAHLSSLLSLPHFFVFAAIDDSRVIGALTAYRLDSYYSPEPQFYLYDVAVLPEFQRQGIGKALLAALTDLARDHGASEVFVQADAEDEHALDFYRKSGGREASVFHYTFPTHQK